MMPSLADLLEPTSEREPFSRKAVCLVEPRPRSSRAYLARLEERDAGAALRVVDPETGLVMGDFVRTHTRRDVVVYVGSMRGRAVELSVDWSRGTGEERAARAAS